MSCTTHAHRFFTCLVNLTQRAVGGGGGKWQSFSPPDTTVIDYFHTAELNETTEQEVTMKPDYLSQGEAARIFPVLSNSSKEGRTTSIVLACLSLVREFGEDVLGKIGQRLGARSEVACYTEIVFKDQKVNLKDRPDGLIVLSTGKNTWRALVETKIGTAQLYPEQIEKYQALAKENGVDAVITISNQYTTDPRHHPCEGIRKSRSKIPVFHFSWMSILTIADLLLSQDSVSDSDQKILLNELVRFLTHESAGLKGFERMPGEWGDLNRLVAAGGSIPLRSPEAVAVIDAWHQETRDLSLIMSRLTETHVTERLPRKLANDPTERQKHEFGVLRDELVLESTLDVPGAAAPLYVEADLRGRSVRVGMTLRAPEDKVSSKARVNWLLRQIKTDKADDLYIRLVWPGRSENTQFSYAELVQDVSVCEAGKEGLQATSFHVFLSRRLGSRFTQQANFITDLEALVPLFYREIGQNLKPWAKPAPRIRAPRDAAEDVSVEGVEQDAVARVSDPD